MMKNIGNRLTKEERDRRIKKQAISSIVRAYLIDKNKTKATKKVVDETN
jgi:hypothetical protein